MTSYKNIDINAWEHNQIQELVTQGEHGIKWLYFTLYDENGVIDLTDATEVVYYAKKPDSKVVYNNLEPVGATFDTSGQAKLKITTQMAVVKGIVHGEIQVVSANGVLKFYGVNLLIKDGLLNQGIESTDEFTALEKALNKVGILTPEGTVDLSDVYLAIEKKLDDADGSVKTNNIKDKSVTAQKIYGIDSTPTGGSTNLIYSTAVHSAIEKAKSDLQKDISNKLDNSDNVIKSGHISNNAVTTDKIANNAITSVKIATSAVDTGQIADKAITSKKLADDIIGSLNDKEDKSNKSDTITNNTTKYPSNKAVYDLKKDIKSHTDLLASVGFDSNNMIIKIVEGNTLGAGAFTGLEKLTKVFVSSNVTQIQSGSFSNSPNLTDIYIDKESIRFDPNEEAVIPSGTNIHYLNDKTFNVITEIAKSINNIDISFNESLNSKENISNKSDTYPAGGKYENAYDRYPSIQYLVNYYYEWDELFTKAESNERFIPDIAVGFDENGVAVRTKDVGNYVDIGDFTSNTKIKKVFLPSKVTGIHIAAFTGCTNLEEIIIDNVQRDVWFGYPPIPAGVKAVYTDAFNAATEFAKGIAYLNENKYDKSNIETGTGTMTLPDEYAKSFSTVNFNYQKIGDYVIVNFDFRTTGAIATTNGVVSFYMDGLPFPCKKSTIQYFRSTNSTEMIMRINDDSTQIQFVSYDTIGVNSRMAPTLIYQIKE